jgi:serine/alanine adding enzyme
MFTIKVYSGQYKAAWSEFVAKCPYANIGHRIGWKEVMEGAFGRRTIYLMAIDHDEIKGILPLTMVKAWWGAKALVSMPWIDYGGVCALDNSVEKILLQKGKEIADQHKVDFMELRSVDACDDTLANREDKVTFYLEGFRREIAQPDQEIAEERSCY